MKKFLTSIMVLAMVMAMIPMSTGVAMAETNWGGGQVLRQVLGI